MSTGTPKALLARERLARLAAFLGTDEAGMLRLEATVLPTLGLRRGLVDAYGGDAINRAALVQFARCLGSSDPEGDVQRADGAIRDVWVRTRGRHAPDAFGNLPTLTRSVAAIFSGEMPWLWKRAGFSAGDFLGLVWGVVTSVFLVAINRALVAALEGGSMPASKIRGMGPGVVRLLLVLAAVNGVASRAGRRADYADRRALAAHLVLVLSKRGFGDEVSTSSGGLIPRLVDALAPALKLPPLPLGDRDRRAFMQRLYREAGLKATPGRPPRRR